MASPPETQCCSRHYLSKSCFSTSRPFLFLLPASVFCAHSLYFAACSPDSSSQDILISVPQTSALGISMKHEKSIRGRGPVSDAERLRMVVWELGRTLGVKWSCRWSATKKKRKERKTGKCQTEGEGLQNDLMAASKGPSSSICSVALSG